MMGVWHGVQSCRDGEAQKKQNDMNELAETNMKQSIEVGMSLVRPKKSVIDRQADFEGFSSDAPNQK